MKDKMKVILATRNEHKVEEINPILSEFGMKAISLNDLSLCDVEVIEDGETFEANSYKKAFEIMKKTGQITIAECTVPDLQGKMPQMRKTMKN